MTIKEAAYAVMEAAYMKASANEHAARQPAPDLCTRRAARSSK